MSKLALDASLAPELVEFWGYRYQEVKDELDKLKESLGVIKSDYENSPHEKERDLHEIIRKLHKDSIDRQQTEDALQQKFIKAQKAENATKKKMDALLATQIDTAQRLAKLQADYSFVVRQNQIYYSQSYMLSGEADLQRYHAITNGQPTESFVEDTFETNALHFADPQAILPDLPTSIVYSSRLCFLPRPPKCMPLRIKARGHPGYWFHPIWSIPEDAEFELIVEGAPAEWMYLGRYMSSPLPHYPMRLSEWVCLDEHTKQEYCARVASSRFAPGVIASQTDQQRLRWQFDSGEAIVPVYQLRCIGFNKSLFEALRAATSQDKVTPALRGPSPAPVVKSERSPLPVRTKKRRRGCSIENNGPPSGTPEETDEAATADPAGRPRTTLQSVNWTEQELSKRVKLNK